MALRSSGPRVAWFFRLLLLFPITVASAKFEPAWAEHLSFRPYAEVDGLTNTDINCLRQGPSGHIFACSDHGLFVYDGKRFVNLGSAQGLPEGGRIFDLAFDPHGRIIVRYASRVFVSAAGIDNDHPAEMLVFKAAVSTVGPFYNEYAHQIAPWKQGAVLVIDGHVTFVDPGTGAVPPRIEAFPLPRGLDIPDSDRVFSVAGIAGALWMTLQSGRACDIDRANQRCYGKEQNLPDANWRSVIAGPDGNIVLRSESLLATIDPATGRVTSQELPFQDGGSLENIRTAELVRGPGTSLITQSSRGLLISHGGSWTRLTPDEGVLDVPFTALLFDHEHNLWLAGAGRGIFRAVGYGLWRNFDRRDGLSDDITWQMARQTGGPLWVTTARGLDAIAATGPRLASAHYSGASYAVTEGATGEIWFSDSRNGAARLDVATGAVTHLRMPAVNHIMRGTNGRMWFATDGGLYVADATGSQASHVTGLDAPIVAAEADPDGSLWLLSRGQLLHRHADGAVVVVVDHWSRPDFEPLDLSFRTSGDIWIGGAGGGLYHVTLLGDRVRSMREFSAPDLLSSTVVSVLVDSRGWVWAGTGSGLSVFNGERWLSVDATAGLAWNDLNQGGLLEDADGTIWVATSQGLSHLLDPGALFRPETLHAVITSVHLGDRVFPRRVVPYTTDPLLVRFGSLDYRSERSLHFRYRLDGVDRGWTDTGEGYARYPFVPAGHHRFSVIAYNKLTHATSPPVSFMIRVGTPWWLWWPTEIGYALLAALAFALAWRVRHRSELRQKQRLVEKVEQATREMRVAQEALVLQAAQDGLTGLLTRAEIQKRLAAALARTEAPGALVAALLDIDHFKKINDTYGHLAGDEILHAMGARVLAMLRPGDYAGRYGGEEILVVLHDQDGSGYQRICALNQSIRCQPFIADHDVIPVTCSIGMSATGRDDDWKSLIGRADGALYQAKSEGRDREVEAAFEAVRA